MEFLSRVFLSIDNFAFLGIYIILAWGLYILTMTGQLSIGQGAFMAVGAYVSAVCTGKLGIAFPLALIAGILAAGLLGLVVGVPSLRIRGVWLVMVTIGLCEIMRVSFNNIEYVGGAAGLHCGGDTTLPIIWGCLAASGIFTWLLERSRFGMSCRAICQDEVVAQHQGINITSAKVTAFILSAAFSGLAGGLYAHYMTYINPTAFGVHMSIMCLLWVILGGMQSFWGPVGGTFIFLYLPELFNFAEKYRELPYFAIVLVMMLFRPQGLISRRGSRRFSKRTRKEVSGPVSGKGSGGSAYAPQD